MNPCPLASSCARDHIVAARPVAEGIWPAIGRRGAAKGGSPKTAKMRRRIFAKLIWIENVYGGTSVGNDPNVVGFIDLN